MQAVQKLKAFDPKVIAQSVRRFDTYLFKQTMKREIERLASL